MIVRKFRVLLGNPRTAAESARGGYLTLSQARYTFQKAAVAVDGCGGPAA
jgi:hypothetical protein